jgi:hypothetical protein
MQDFCNSIHRSLGALAEQIGAYLEMKFCPLGMSRVR